MNRDTIIEAMRAVTQADRDAAARYLSKTQHIVVAPIRRGESDQSAIVQAFARHRQAALTTCLPMIREELAKFVEERTASASFGEKVFIREHDKLLASAIRNHKFEGE